MKILNEDLSISSSIPYQDSHGILPGIKDKSIDNINQEEILTPSFSASNRLFRMKNTLPALDNYYQPKEMKEIIPTTKSMSVSNLPFNSVSNENMGIYGNISQKLNINKPIEVKNRPNSYSGSRPIAAATFGHGVGKIPIPTNDTFIDYNSGYIGNIGGIGGGGSVMSLLSKHTMEMNYSVSEHSSISSK